MIIVLVYSVYAYTALTKIIDKVKLYLKNRKIVQQYAEQ